MRRIRNNVGKRIQHKIGNWIFNDKEQFASTSNSVINAARLHNIPLFFTRIPLLPTRYDLSAGIYAGKYIYSKFLSSPYRQLIPHKNNRNDDDNCRTITKDDLALAVKPNEDEIIIDKQTASILSCCFCLSMCNDDNTEDSNNELCLFPLENGIWEVYRAEILLRS